jgi:hypothetical protein
MKQCLLASGIAMTLAADASAQTLKSPPNFSSNHAAWQTAFGGNFITVPGVPGPMTDDPAHPHQGNNNRGLQPTYRIADLTHSNLKQWAKDIMKKDNDEVLAGKIAFTPGQSCVPPGVPDFISNGGPFYFVQTPNEVLMFEQGDNYVRRVYLNVPHSANLKPSWYGESVGHYQGDTLVIDTIGLNTKTFVDRYRTPHSEKLHVIERWRLIDDGKQIEVHVTVDDPETYYQPWQYIRRFNRLERPYAETICREGNFILFDYEIPIADRPDF